MKPRSYCVKRPTLGALVMSVTLAGTLSVAGCGNDDPPATTPTPVSPVTEAVSGTLTPFSARIHGIQVQNAGTISATLTSLTQLQPDVNTVVGLDIGTLIGSTCQVVVSRTDVTVNVSVTGTATAAGSICIRVYDITQTGLTAPVDYAVTVVHY